MRAVHLDFDPASWPGDLVVPERYAYGLCFLCVCVLLQSQSQFEGHGTAGQWSEFDIQVPPVTSSRSNVQIQKPHLNQKLNNPRLEGEGL